MTIKYDLPDRDEVFREVFSEQMAKYIERNPDFVSSISKTKKANEVAKALFAWMTTSEGESLRTESYKIARERYDALLEEASKDVPISVPMIMETDPNFDGQTLYRRIKQFVARFSKGSIEISGYRTETHQRALQVAFDQNKPFEDQLQILEFVPYIKPAKPNRYLSTEKRKIIGVFEYTLSKNEIYYIEIAEDGQVYFCTHIRELKEFPDLKSCLRYVYDHHPYKRLGEI